MTKSTKGAPVDPVDRVRFVRERLEGSGAFEITVLEETPATAESIAEAESRLGRSLPAGLRRLYEEPVALYWQITDAEALGYEEDCEPLGGQLEVLPPGKLRIDERGLVRFTNDGFGNGFCLRRDGDEIAWWDHDARASRAYAASFDEFFDKWAVLGFAIDPSASGDLEAVAQLIDSGRLPDGESDA